MLEILWQQDWRVILVEPWTEAADISVWTVAMGLLVGTACGWVGTFLVLRRMALTGDAISHGVLPGLVAAFLLAGSRDIGVMMVGAVVAALVTMLAIHWIERTSPIKADAAMVVVFTTLFAFGIVLITAFAGQVDLDTECVLYGEIGFEWTYPAWTFGGLNLGPEPVARMGLVTLVVGAVLGLFYRHWMVTAFDPVLALCLGIKSQRWHRIFLVLVALVVVASFEAVGVILVVAMLIFPAATGLLLFQRLPSILALVPVLALAYALGGYHLALWLDCSVAGAMSVVAFLIFGSILLGKQIRRFFSMRTPPLAQP